MEKTNINIEQDKVTIEINITLDNLTYLQKAVESREQTVTHPRLYTKYKRLLDELNLIRKLVNIKIEDNNKMEDYENAILP